MNLNPAVNAKTQRSKGAKLIQMGLLAETAKQTRSGPDQGDGATRRPGEVNRYPAPGETRMEAGVLAVRRPRP